MLGRQAIIDRQQVRTRRVGDAPREMPIGRRRPEPVAAAVQIENMPVRTRGGRGYEVRPDATGIDRRRSSAPRWVRNKGFHAAEGPPRLLDRLVVGTTLDEPAQSEPHQFGSQTGAVPGLHASMSGECGRQPLWRFGLAGLLADEPAVLDKDDAVRKRGQSRIVRHHQNAAA